MLRTQWTVAFCVVGCLACEGSGGNGPPPLVGDNVIDLVVDPGPLDSTGKPVGYTNGLFATVTVCVPGTTTCDTIDHVLVDTGSIGLRVLESAVTIALPAVTSAAGDPLAGCYTYVDGTVWGPLKQADVVMGNESAPAMTIHLIGERTFSMPSSCSGTAVTDLDTLGANGILGIGLLRQDCGSMCEQSGWPGYYYACAGATAVCSLAVVPASQQVTNPVAALPVDNNGVVIQLPSVGINGANKVNGQMAFGIGTQANNGLDSASLVSLDAQGFSRTLFPVDGTQYTSIIDSGSNGLFFLNTAITQMPTCARYPDFYCPSSLTRLSAAVVGPNGPATVDFAVQNAEKLGGYALNDIAGPMPGYPSPSLPAFDWGLPFFFGRKVFTAIEGKDTPAGLGPYVAF
jgi:hypothetical protein